MPENKIHTFLNYSGPQKKISYHWNHSSNPRKHFGQNYIFSASSRHFLTLLDGQSQQHSKPNFLRDHWKANWTWDEELPEQKKEEWKTIAVNLAKAKTFLRPRYRSRTEKNLLDVFVDSSFSAYAAVAYHNDELYMAKTRLAPVSSKTDLMLVHQKTRVDGNGP